MFKNCKTCFKIKFIIKLYNFTHNYFKLKIIINELIYYSTNIDNNKKFRCLKIKYGDILKFVAKEFFNWNGEKDEKGRTLLQWLGTDLGRKNNINVWVNCVKEIVKGLKTEYDFVLVSDARFPNELDWDDTEFFTFTVRLNRKNEK